MCCVSFELTFVLCVVAGADWSSVLTGTTAATISSPADSIPEDEEFLFNCTLSKPSRDAVTISAHVTVFSAQVPVVTIIRDATKFKAETVLALIGNGTLGASQFQWSASPYVDFNQATAGTSATTASLFLMPNTLTPGASYQFTLTAAVQGSSVAGSVRVPNVTALLADL